MTDQILRLILTGDSGQAVAAVDRSTAALKKQEQQIKQNQQQEKLRGLQQQALLKQNAANYALERVGLDASMKNQLAAMRAVEAAKRSEASLSIARQKATLAANKEVEAGRLSMANFGKSAIGAIGGAIAQMGLLLAATGAVTAAVGILGTEFKAAMEASSGSIASGISYSRDFGLSFAQGRQAAIQQQIAFEKQGRALPISSEDINQYATLFQNAGFSRQFGGDRAAFEKLFVGNSSSLGVPALYALLRNQYRGLINDTQAQNTAGLLADPNATSSSIGASEFGRLSGLSAALKAAGFDQAIGTAKAQILATVIQSLQPPEAIAAQQAEVGALWSNFYDGLFAPRTGVFGFLKDVNTDLEGDQTILDAASKAITLLIGDNGIFAKIADLIGGGDPTRMLYDNIQGFNQYLERVNTALGSAVDSGKSGTEPIANAFNFKEFINAAISGRSNLGTSIGKQLADGINGALDFIIANPMIGTAISAEVSRGLGSFLAAIDYPKLIGGFVLIMVDAVGVIGAAIAGTALQFSIDAANNIGSSYIQPFFGGIGDAIGGFFSSIGASISGAFQATIQWIADNAQSILLKGASLIPGVGGIAASALNSAISATQAAPRYMGSLAASASGGFMPLGSAIAAEMANKPAGSQLVIANSSELILPASDARRMMSGGSNVVIEAGAIVVQTASDAATTADAVLDVLSQKLAVRLAAIG